MDIAVNYMVLGRIAKSKSIANLLLLSVMVVRGVRSLHHVNLKTVGFGFANGTCRLIGTCVTDRHPEISLNLADPAESRFQYFGI